MAMPTGLWLLTKTAGLAEKNVLTELHIFPNGPHGLSLCNDTTAVVPEEVQPDCECWAGMAARFLHNAM